MKGQLSLTGREYQEAKLKIAGLDIEIDLADLDSIPEQGDQFEVTMRFAVTTHDSGGRVDNQGVGSSPYGMIIETRPIYPGFQINGFRTLAELDIAFWGAKQAE